ncbi:ABC transporter permease [Parabacteroides bouchesdurhonensis]|uniref:ABC transporter permease n=1 Tax=Parabacteroides bouchesdurhonensis TaxID=1936995 RepID=UPI000E54836D|nr:ABC transporter permease [Parabacteroides bouchesdurhonensis]RHJ92431.1 ABC transporter permease [Bacteroides sp. AM07-16]
MIRLYFKQAWNLIRQERLFSSVYILGTGLSISMVMVLSIVFYIRLADIYPETNRSRILIAERSRVEERNRPGYVSTGNLSESIIRTCLGSLEGVEAIALELNDRSDFYVQPAGKETQLPVAAKFVNTDFWKVFPFRFTGGQPFTEADQLSRIPTVVIAQSLARRLFGDEDAVGQYISLNFRQYKVCGTVQDASYLTSRSYAQLWIPYTVSESYQQDTWGDTSTQGGYFASVLVAPDADIEKVKQAAEDNVQRYSNTLPDYTFSMMGQPDYYWQSVLRTWEDNIDFGKLILQYALVFFILLLVPAVSLSGMTDLRMERRLAEMGVRRAFGAPVGALMKQILSENLFFTLLGGLLGLLFSYLLLFLTRDWVMQIGISFVETVHEDAEIVIPASMLLNYTVFGVALAVCFVLNLLSALIPAWRASRRQIIYSLNAK